MHSLLSMKKKESKEKRKDQNDKYGMVLRETQKRPMESIRV